MRISDWSSDVCSSDLTMGIVQHRIGVVDAQLAGGDRLNIRVEAAVLIVEGRRLGLGAPCLALLHVLQIDDAVLYAAVRTEDRSEEHTSELQSLMRISYAVFSLKKKHIEK